jgi:hypothetical protein
MPGDILRHARGRTLQYGRAELLLTIAAVIACSAKLDKIARYSVSDLETLSLDVIRPYLPTSSLSDGDGIQASRGRRVLIEVIIVQTKARTVNLNPA